MRQGGRVVLAEPCFQLRKHAAGRFTHRLVGTLARALHDGAGEHQEDVTVRNVAAIGASADESTERGALGSVRTEIQQLKVGA